MLIKQACADRFPYVLAQMMRLRPLTETLRFRAESLYDIFDICNLTTTPHLFHDVIEATVAHLEKRD